MRQPFNAFHDCQRWGRSWCWVMPVVLSACAFATKPEEPYVLEPAPTVSTQAEDTSPAEPSELSEPRAGGAAGGAVNNTASASAGANADAGAPDAAVSRGAAGSAPASTAPAQPPTAANTPEESDAGTEPLDGGVSTRDASVTPTDAGTAAPPTMTAEEAQCAADLASCLIVNPLGYAECLRMNAENHCELPDAMAPHVATNSQGEPLSTVCSAELAACITRNPTPEHALACQKQADTCTSP